MLSYISNVPWEYSDAVLPDYVLGDTTCALYLSLKYHMLHPKYLHSRIGYIKHRYQTRAIVCHIDVDDNEQPLRDVTKIAFGTNWTLICAWSFEEVARYLETFRSYERKSADLIRGKVDEKDTKGMVDQQQCNTIPH